MPKARRYKYRELVKVLKEYGIVVMAKRGKGSERMLYRESTKDNFPIKYRSENYQYSISMIKAIQRRFDLPNDFLF